MSNSQKHMTPVHFAKPAKSVACWLLCFFMGMQLLQAQTPASKEYKVKAVFIYNFIQFVDWPQNSFASETSPFIIGILGDDPFGTAIDEVVAGEKFDRHPVIVQRYHDVKEIKNCQILYLSSGEAEHLREDLAVLPGTGMLTVSDNNNFARMGGMIRFFTQNNKIRLQINPDAARAVNLIISSKLLRVSEIYDPNKPQQ